MERNSLKNRNSQEDACTRNSTLAHQVISSALRAGVKEFCVCTGARNSSLIDCLDQIEGIQAYFFYDERSAAFFALGRAKSSQRPIAVLTTSGTAVGELLPAVMEAYYSQTPLLLLTADRPRNFRGTGAPQAAEQVSIFGCYATFMKDVEYGESPLLDKWKQNAPAHLNICLEESYKSTFDSLPDFPPVQPKKRQDDKDFNFDRNPLSLFLQESQFPIAIVGSLMEKDQKTVAGFLKKHNIPSYCEGASGIRESVDLKEQRVTVMEKLWQRGARCEYPIDGVLRIGGMPTTRIWRDLENKKGEVSVCSISHLPFSGLSWGNIIYTDITRYLDYSFSYRNKRSQLVDNDKIERKKLKRLLETYESSEPSLFYYLSTKIPEESLLYIGNSLPIREWDLAATYKRTPITVNASRGLNGIDGQLSTFLGLCDPQRNNWAIVGDLTALYDLSAPWILSQIKAKNIQIIVINNAGGKIFSRMYKNSKLQNTHEYRFQAIAEMWGMEYSLCKNPLENICLSDAPRIIEWIPCESATKQFWDEYERTI